MVVSVTSLHGKTETIQIEGAIGCILNGYIVRILHRLVVIVGIQLHIRNKVESLDLESRGITRHTSEGRQHDDEIRRFLGGVLLVHNSILLCLKALGDLSRGGNDQRNVNIIVNDFMCVFAFTLHMALHQMDDDRIQGLVSRQLIAVSETEVEFGLSIVVSTLERLFLRSKELVRSIADNQRIITGRLHALARRDYQTEVEVLVVVDFLKTGFNVLFVDGVTQILARSCAVHPVVTRSGSSGTGSIEGHHLCTIINFSIVSCKRFKAEVTAAAGPSGQDDLTRNRQPVISCVARISLCKQHTFSSGMVIATILPHTE